MPESRRSRSALEPPEATRDPVHIRVRELHKSYGPHHVLKGLDVELLRARVNMVIGPSGSGKSVLMRQVTRLERPDAGHILLDGEDLAPLRGRTLAEARRRFGMVFQLSALFDSMTVYDNVAFPLREHSRLSERAIRERVMGRLAELGVDRAAAKMPAELSGGMQRRVAVARALMLDTEILIYDEPTTGLDPITARQVDDLIVETRERHGVTTVVVSHDIASVFRIAEHVVFLHFGEVLAEGPPEHIRDHPHSTIRAFLSSAGI